MDKAMSEVAASLKTMQETIVALSEEWNGGKGSKGEINATIKGLCNRIKNMGNNLRSLLRA